ncbi:MAG: HAD family hydrolase [Pseudomonadota bacterium]
MTCLSIIFDLDGTLLDTLYDIAETSNAVLSHYGFPIHAHKEYQGFVGDGLRVLMERITPQGADTAVINSCCELFVQLYANNWMKTCRPYHGIEEMLATIRKQGLGMAVLSNKPHAFTKLFINKYFPGNHFTCVYGQREGFAKKPDPTVALEIAKNLKARPEEIFFVGDTPIDIRTGKASAMTTVGVTWGFRSVSEIEKENPDIIINSPMELLQYVKPLT